MSWIRLLGVLAMVAAGCARSRPAPLPIALGPYTPSQGHELISAVSTAMDQIGYPPVSSSPETGRFEATAHTRIRGATPTIAVQLYREGWVAVGVAGLPERRSGRSMLVEREAEDLAFKIQERLRERGLEVRGQ